MDRENKNKPKLLIPHLPNNDSEGEGYNIISWQDNLVCKYTNLNILQIENLSIVEYLLYLRDAFIEMCYKTEKGQKYLEDCYRMSQTEPDRNALRDKFGKGEKS